MYIRTFKRLLAAFPIVAMLFLSFGCGSYSPRMRNSACSGCQFLYATTNTAQMLVFPVSIDGVLGTPVSVAGPPTSAGLMALAPVGPNPLYLYISDPQDSAIHVYTVNPIDGVPAAAPVGPFPLGNGAGTPGEMAAFGDVLYVTGSAGSIAAFNVNADGSPTRMAGSPFMAGAGVSHLAVVPSFTVDNTTFLYASNTNDPNGSITAFSITPTGGLVPVPGSPFATVGGAGPEAFYDGGKFLYVALKNLNSVAAFAIADNGSLAPITGSPFPAGRGTFSIGGSGGFLFATNNVDGTISSYSIDPTTGILTQVAGSPFPGVVSSGDAFYLNSELFVPNAASNTINGFLPDQTGAISPMAGSPFKVGAGPIALTAGGFPVIDPPAAH